MENTTPLINTMYYGCERNQWCREVIQNAIEAKATKVEFGVEWQGVKKFKIYRRMIADNGIGMSLDEMKEYFSQIGKGNKLIGSLHDNFGIGSRISLAPWNPLGITFLSYKDGECSMARMAEDPITKEYVLEAIFEDKYGRASCFCDPRNIKWEEDDIDWSKVGPAWAKKHGTIIVLHGSIDNQDTILGEISFDSKKKTPKPRSTREFPKYFNTRFWDIASHLDLSVIEFYRHEKSEWPKSLETMNPSNGGRPRKCVGAKYFLSTPSKSKKQNAGCCKAEGKMYFDAGKTLVMWSLWEGERSDNHSYAYQDGYIAVKYKNELYHVVPYSHITWRLFGINATEVKKNLSIIIEPQHFSEENQEGVHPDQTRSHLLYSSHDKKGVAEMPWSSWGQQFVQNLCDAPEIYAAIKAASTGSMQGNQKLLQRLLDQLSLGERFRKTIDAVFPEAKNSTKGTATDEDVEIEVGFGKRSKGSGDCSHTPSSTDPNTKPRKLYKTKVANVTNGGNDDTIKATVNYQIPDVKLVDGYGDGITPENGFSRCKNICFVIPKDAETQRTTLYLNVTSPLVQQQLKHFQDRFDHELCDEVRHTVYDVYSSMACAKYMHIVTQHSRDMSMEEIEKDYLNENAFTTALSGLYSEDVIISNELRNKFSNSNKAVNMVNKMLGM